MAEVGSGLESISDLPPFASASTRDLLDFGLQSVVQRQRRVEIIVRTHSSRRMVNGECTGTLPVYGNFACLRRPGWLSRGAAP